jgi:hypothetical protein
LHNEENSDDEERPRRRSADKSPQRQESPIPRSVSSPFDENDTIDEQTSVRSTTGKKKKVIGAGRHRLHGDTLPPLAPSSSASRRDDFSVNKGPPAGTPRPQPVVAQWAITSPSPRVTAEKLTTIASDNELDDDEVKRKPLKPSNRIVSPHPLSTNRIIRDKKPQLTNDDDNESFTSNDFKKSSREKRQTNLNDDDDDNFTRKSSSVQKSRPKLSDDDEDEFGDNRKKTNSKKNYNKNDDNDDDFNRDSSRRAPSSSRKTTGGDSSSRSHSRNNANVDDDLR